MERREEAGAVRRKRGECIHIDAISAMERMAAKKPV
jgi:hypothetical protein